MANQQATSNPVVPSGTLALIIFGFVLGLAGLFFGVPLTLLGVVGIGVGCWRSAGYYVAAGATLQYRRLAGVLLLLWGGTVASFWALYLRAAHLNAGVLPNRPDAAVARQVENLQNLMWPLMAAGIALLVVVGWVLLRMAKQARNN